MSKSVFHICNARGSIAASVAVISLHLPFASIAGASEPPIMAAAAISESNADNATAQLKIPHDARYCSFVGHAHEFGKRLPFTVSRGMTVETVRPLIARIQDYSGVDTNLDIYSGRAPNAAAVVFPGQQQTLRRAIVYHPLFLSYLDKRAQVAGQRSTWPALSVFAHEIGHHLAGHTLRIQNQRHYELQADWYSGYILGKMGADQQSAQRVLTTFGSEATETHPSSGDRLAAVSDGWRQAKCELGDKAGCKLESKPFTRETIEREREKDRKESEDLDKNQIAPRLMCQIRGESIAIDKQNKVYWLRHYESRLRPVSLAAPPAAGSKRSSSKCPGRLHAKITSDITIEICDDGKSSRVDALVLPSTDGPIPREPPGRCERCDVESSLCPDQI